MATVNISFTYADPWPEIVLEEDKPPTTGMIVRQAYNSFGVEGTHMEPTIGQIWPR